MDGDGVVIWIAGRFFVRFSFFGQLDRLFDLIDETRILVFRMNLVIQQVALASPLAGRFLSSR